MNLAEKLNAEFGAIQDKANAAQVASEYGLPEDDADILLSYNKDPRMMRVLAKRLAEELPPTMDDLIRS